jgi:glutamine amidotransferase
VDEDLAVDFAALTTPRDQVTVIATAPLTADERWTPLPAGVVVAFEEGALVDPPDGASSAGHRHQPGTPSVST